LYDLCAAYGVINDDDDDGLDPVTSRIVTLIRHSCRKDP